MLSESNDIFFSLSLVLQTTASVPLVVFSLCSHSVLVKEDRAGIALIWVMVYGEIRAGVTPPWCPVTQQRVKLESVGLALSMYKGGEEGSREGRGVRLAASGSLKFCTWHQECF